MMDILRATRFSGTAKLLLQKLDQPGLSPEERQTIATECVYDIVNHTLNAAWPRYQQEMQFRMRQGGEIFVDVPDLTQWPDS